MASLLLVSSEVVTLPTVGAVSTWKEGGRERGREGGREGGRKGRRGEWEGREEVERWQGISDLLVTPTNTTP